MDSIEFKQQAMGILANVHIYIKTSKNEASSYRRIIDLPGASATALRSQAAAIAEKVNFPTAFVGRKRSGAVS